MRSDSKERGGEYRVRGISSDLACILVGVDGHGDCFSLQGKLGKERAKEMLEGRVAKGSIISTDGHPAYMQITHPKLDADEHSRYDTKDMGYGQSRELPALSPRQVPRLTHGYPPEGRRTATCFRIFKELKVPRGEEGIGCQAYSGLYENRWSDYRKTPYPFCN